ncbi:hypothetical protein CDCA_CDCA10G2854 [Cyanidium caldarium]|uniref:PDZ domain-containing protein n=1 Tax=Cyanidium caldarium TaxID=2771 RepID=A0AAV9IX16_CYACA|nr:hypothetical protein CDCA_CDCA10G2854 [Cyanidium caldarium]
MQSLRRALWTARGVWSRRGLQQSAPHPFRRVPGAYRRSWARAAALTAAAAAVSGVAALSYWVDHANTPLFERYTWRARMEEAALSPDVAPEIHKGARRADAPLTRYTVADAVARVAPAVVNITVTLTTGDRWAFGPFFPQPSVAQSTGSGFIFDDREGLVLTNAHVVSEMRNTSQAAEMRVTLQDGRSFTGVVESVDALTDLAVVRIRDAGDSLPAAPLGTSATLRAGEWVIAVGSPLMLANTVTFGIVSAAHRESFELGLPMAAPKVAFIQTDAAINIGNSGGPLVNLDGEVIGINSLKALSSDGISFALPIDVAKEVVAQLRQHGRVVRPFLGLKLITLTPALAEELRRRSGGAFPPDVHQGVCVPQVLPGGPADRGGLRAGDVIVEFDGRPVRTTRDLLDLLGDNIQRPVPVVVLRGQAPTRLTLQVTPEQAKV